MKATSLRTLAILALLVLIVTALTLVSGAPEAAAAPPAHGPEPGHPTEAAAETQETPLLGNLGDYHHAITTQSELAQRYFNQGLILAYGFNHEKAIESFKAALKSDPQCAMCYWGIAYALGPNINAPMEDAAVPEAYAAVQQAQKLAAQVSPREQAYIQALAQRYVAKPVADRADLDLAYANAMRQVAKQYPLATIAQTEAIENLTLYSFAQASTMLDIATHVLAGELAGAAGETDQMIAELEKAVAIQDGLHYIEPPAWHYPVRHNLGAALLKAGRPAEAEAVYREDLRQYANNGWSLFGLAKSLEAQGKTAEAAKVQQQFETAWHYADVTLTTSRF